MIVSLVMRPKKLYFLPKPYDPEQRRYNGDPFVGDAADGEHEYVIEQNAGGSEQDAFAQQLRISEGHEDRIGGQSKDDQQRHRTLPGEGAQRHHDQCQNGSGYVVELGFFILKIESDVTDDAHNVQGKAGTGTQKQIAQTGTKGGGGGSDQ